MLLFEALVMAMVQAMPVAVVARMVEEWDTRLWWVIHHYVEAARDRAEHAAVNNLAVDETAARRGHNHVSLFVDLVRRRVLFVAEGRDADTVETFAKDLIAHGGNPQAIAKVRIDRSPAFIAGIAQSLPNAQITFDKFHVIIEHLSSKPLSSPRSIAAGFGDAATWRAFARVCDLDELRSG